MEHLNRFYKLMHGSFGHSRQGSKHETPDTVTSTNDTKADKDEQSKVTKHISASTSNLDNIGKSNSGKTKMKLFSKKKTSPPLSNKSFVNAGQESSSTTNLGAGGGDTFKSNNPTPSNRLQRKQSSSLANISMISSSSSTPPSLLAVEKSKPQQQQQQQQQQQPAVSSSAPREAEPFSSTYEPRGIQYPEVLTRYQTPSEVHSTKELIEVLILNLQILERKNDFLEDLYLNLERKHQLLSGRLERKSERLRQARAEVWVCLICGQNWAQLAQLKIDCYSLRCGHIFCYRCCMRHAGRCVRCKDIFVVDKKILF